MVVTVTVFILGATLFLLVDAGCSKNQVTTANDATCREWWDTGKGYEHSVEKREKCVKLIKEMCTHMIDIMPLTTAIKNAGGNYEKLTTEIKISRKGDLNNWMTYHETEKRPVCSYDGQAVYCDYWWDVARDSSLNGVKKVCINRILHHCGNMITKIEEQTLCEITICINILNIKRVTFELETGERVSYTRNN